LEVSLKIQELWPEAFDAGKCQPKCSCLQNKLTGCWLEREDGVRKYIHPNEYRQLGFSIPEFNTHYRVIDLTQAIKMAESDY
ncbi:hypothetical protein, partial [Kistimonas scapharcae]|uniref:hypothetical protein n=1 Tax=Kistimonas scapharcae TaxID=1036133 RepID=UPI0031E8444A